MLKKILLALLFLVIIFGFGLTSRSYASEPIGAWSQNPTGLPNPYAGLSFTGNNKIYFISLSPSGLPVITNTPNSDGTLGSTWGNEPSLTYNPFSAAIAKKGNLVYILGGGQDPGIFQKKVILSTIQSDGSLSSWQSLNDLPVGTSDGGAAAVGDWLYYMGGADGSSGRAEIYFAHINSDGTIGNWNTSNISLPYSIQGFSVVVHGSDFYVIGGQINYSTTILNTVYKTTVNNGDGSLSPWVQLESRPQPLTGRPQSIVIGSKIVSYGGGPYGGPLSPDVFYTSINADGTIEPWQISANSLPVETGVGAMAYLNGYLYILGGITLSGLVNTVYYAPFAGDSLPNQQPVVNSISPSNSLAQVNNTVSASSSFTDGDSADTHTAFWDWGDGNITNGSVSESNGSGTVSGNHTYTTAGVYSITLTVTDNNNSSNSSTYQYVVVYDPSAGFLTGSGKYTSQAGWYTSNTSASGDFKFGIQAKYTNNNFTPTGDTKLKFQAGDLELNSTSYEWLVISGAKATLKGNASVNGTSGYTFLISAIDGSQTNGPNLIRVQIKDLSNTVIYDTQSGDPDTADPTTPINSGLIKVH